MRTDVTVILDRSGSMAATRDDAMGGFNALVADQKRLAGEARLSLVQFDDRYQVDYRERPMADVPDLTPDTYEPRGSTALLDAIGRTIDDVGERLSSRAAADRPDKVVVVVITDGQENASHTFSARDVRDQIAHQRDVYKWEFIFVGSNQDAIASAAKMNIDPRQSLSFASSKAGTQGAWGAVSDYLSEVRTVGSSEFTRAQRAQAMASDSDK